MAKLDNSIYTPNRRGSIGDSVFGKNKYGLFERKKPKRRKAFTPAELSRQEAMGVLSPKWGELEEWERQSWCDNIGDEVGGKLRNKNLKEGYNVFIGVNLKLIALGEPYRRTGINFNKPQEFESFSIFIEKIKRKKRLLLVLPEKEIEESTLIIIRGTDKYSAGIMKPNPNQYKIFAVIDCKTMSFDNSSNIYDLTSAYEEKFGRLPIDNQKVSFEFSSMNRENAITTLPQTTCILYRDEEKGAKKRT